MDFQFSNYEIQIKRNFLLDIMIEGNKQMRSAKYFI